MPTLSRKLLFFIICICSSLATFAGVIKGKVTDAKTGEPLVGATVEAENGRFKLKATVNLDGSFTLKNVPAGEYQVKVKFTGYKTPKDLRVIIKEDKEVISLGGFELQEEVLDLGEVSVKSGAGFKETDNGVRRIEKNSDYVQNILSQKSIELSPDVTVANSLQRMSGVTIQRSSSGEGRYAIIRGMDQRYNTTLVNGIKIPSPDDKYRYVPMDIFPSDLLERLEVIKALTPNMEADAIGGVMNLVMKSAPNKETFNVFAATGANTLFNDRPFVTFNQGVINKKSPAEIHGAGYAAADADFPRSNLSFNPLSTPVNLQTGITYGNRYFKKRLGFILGVSFQNNYRGSNQILNAQYPGAKVLLPSATGGSLVNNYPEFSDAIDNKYSTQQRRIAVNNKWDYVLNKNNKISLYNLYVHMDEFQARYSADTDVNTNPGNVALTSRSRWQIQDIYNSTLHGDHSLSSHLKMNWDAAYSVAKQQIPDMAQFEVDYVKTKNADGSMSLPLNFVSMKGMNRIWSHNTDKDLAGYLNFIYGTKIHEHAVEFSWGGLFRHKNRDNYYIKYSLSPVSSTTQKFTDIYAAQYSFNTQSGDAPTGDPGTGRNYSVKEDVAAGYGQFKFMATSKLQVLGGVRVENTDQHYTTNLPDNVNAQYGHIYYIDVLPSLHLKYELNKRQNIRASYFRSLVRPGFAEIIPQDIPASENEAYEQQGNPYLKHTTADNYDLRYELFPQGADQLLLGGFVKRIYNPIETVFSHYSVLGGNSSPGTYILTPTNVGNVTNYGAEAVITKYFGKFGITANYTYTHSATTTTKSYLRYDSVAATKTDSVSQTRPLQGQAKHIANVALIYKNPKIGLDIQLAYVYTGERIALVNIFYNLDTWQAPYSQLDFSFEKRIVKKLALYGKINNITNSQTKFYIKQPYLIGNTLNKIPGQDDPTHSIIVQRDLYKISYLLGLRYKL